MEEDNPFGALFDEPEGETCGFNTTTTQIGQLPTLPDSQRAESGFVGLMNQFPK